MGNWSNWSLKVVLALGVCAAMPAVGCGNTSENSPKAQSNAGQPGAGGAGGMSNGTSGQLGAGSPGAGSTGVPVTPGDPEELEVCRNYFTTKCERVQECGATEFGPCWSAIDACPDVLFADGSGWTVEQVVACTSEWTTHDCAAIELREEPPCSEVLGSRALGSACVFDSQCQNGFCNEGILPSYGASCGVCAELVADNGVCSKEHPCELPWTCQGGICLGRSLISDSCLGLECVEGQQCDEGACVGFVPLGGVCTPTLQCVEGLGCAVSAPGAEEPTGTCQPLPALGAPCLPTFGGVGSCSEGGTCNGHPTGECVPPATLGEPCGATQCAEGLFCNYLYEALELLVCHEPGPAGTPCDRRSLDGGDAACADGLQCLCPDIACWTAACALPRQSGQSCDGVMERCIGDYYCKAGFCVAPDEGPLAAGMPCQRVTNYGRDSHGCEPGLLECLCTDPACGQSLCALPRLSGETCNGTTELCRQGLACTAGQCQELEARDLEAEACAASAP